MLIQMSNTSGEIFHALPKEQNTKPSSGRPSSDREGPRGAIGRWRSFAW